jgi:hypothetical protein
MMSMSMAIVDQIRTAAFGMTFSEFSVSIEARGLTGRPFSCAPPPLVEWAEVAKIDAKRLTQSIGKSGGVSAATAC